MVDRYTKCVLTIIAIGLFANFLKDVSFHAKAENGVTKVAVCRVDGSFCANIGGNPFVGEVGRLTVEIKQ